MIVEDECDAEIFARVKYWKDYSLESRNVFPTESSLRWFLRIHETELVAVGALLKFPRGNYIDPMRFRAAAIRLMLPSTQRTTSQGDNHA